jgi:hypothetical protein
MSDGLCTVALHEKRESNVGTVGLKIFFQLRAIGTDNGSLW